MSSIDAGPSWTDDQWEADLSVGPRRPVPTLRYLRTIAAHQTLAVGTKMWLPQPVSVPTA